MENINLGNIGKKDLKPLEPRFGYIPKHLEIPERPELAVFSFNILFTQDAMVKGERITGSAIYEPVLSSYFRTGDTAMMWYQNIYGEHGHIVMEYDHAKVMWTGTKFVRGKRVLLATGPEWNKFFIHLTLVGLANGEPCLFEHRPRNPK